MTKKKEKKPCSQLYPIVSIFPQLKKARTRLREGNQPSKRWKQKGLTGVERTNIKEERRG